MKPRNDPALGVTKFCRSLEEHRRTDIGRVRTPKELVEYFFPHDAEKAEDKIFTSIPPSVRGPIISGWGIRGAKSALKDTDEKVKRVVHDALLAGDINETMFEHNVTPDVIIDWVPLADWWSFWRSGRIAGAPVQKALAFARELELFDDKWFLENTKGRGGRLVGTDIVCDTLSKDQIVAWIRNIHQTGDGSPAGLVTAIGWDVILAKTSQEALLVALDAFARKVGLVSAPAEPERPVRDTTKPIATATPASEPPWTAEAAPFPAAPPATYGLKKEDDESTSEHVLKR